MTPFAAVLLAGGRSRRMGRDKALLPLPDGRLLWQRQLALLQTLEPAELFISGPPREGFPPDIACLPDAVPGQGPLGGIVSAMQAMRSARLLVLAVDLPAMTARCLRGLLDADPALAVVPQHPDTRFYEPLAAVYPVGCGALADAALRSTDRSLQSFVRSLPKLRAQPITAREVPLFANWNTPSELS